MRIEKADSALGYERLKSLVRSESEIHAVGIGTDENLLGGKYEIHGLAYLLLLLGLRKRPEAVGAARLVDFVEPHHALHGMHALASDETRGPEKKSSDARKELPFGVLSKYRLTKYFHSPCIIANSCEDADRLLPATLWPNSSSGGVPSDYRGRSPEKPTVPRTST